MIFLEQEGVDSHVPVAYWLIQGFFEDNLPTQFPDLEQEGFILIDLQNFIIFDAHEDSAEILAFSMKTGRLELVKLVQSDLELRKLLVLVQVDHRTQVIDQVVVFVLLLDFHQHVLVFVQLGIFLCVVLKLIRGGHVC